MNLYKVSVKKADESGKRQAVFVGSQAEAATARKKFVEDGFKRVEIETETLDIPTNKEGLLSWLNANAA
jgi:hypothetical protein